MSGTVRAVKFLFVGPAVLVLLAIINAMTSPGDWWVKWAALGIGIFVGDFGKGSDGTLDYWFE